MAQISHVDNLLVQLRCLVEEAGGVAQLARDSGAGCAETTYIAVAEKAGVPYQVFWLYLNGSQSPMTNTLQKIADALEMEVADLFLPPDGG